MYQFEDGRDNYRHADKLRDYFYSDEYHNLPKAGENDEK